MADLAFVLTVIAFFSLAGLFVTFCDKVIGLDDEVSAGTSEPSQSDRLAA